MRNVSPSRRLGFAVLAAIIAACAPAVEAPPSPLARPLVVYEGGRLAYSDGTDLFVVEPSGLGRRRLTTDGGQGFYVGGLWSPDGRYVAAERMPENVAPSQLVLIDATSGAARAVSAPGAWLDGYSWSPDGKAIVFAKLVSGGTLASGGTLEPERGEVLVYDLASGALTPIGLGVHPSWSPDGKSIAYVHAAGAIAVSAPDGGQLRFIASLADLNRQAGPLAPRGYRLLNAPAWSRDGAWLAFSAIEAGPILEALQVIFVGPPVAGAPLRAYAIGRTGAQHHAANLQWSPSSARLAFSFIYAEPHHHYLGVIDPKARDAAYLFDATPHFLDYTWSPDGSQILVAIDDKSELAVIGVDPPAREVVRLSFFGYHPHWCCAAR